ncbi:MAG: Mu transposase domain-containing protein, partial [Streptosporangiaceae bacterium]
FEAFGAVPQLVVCDNLKAGVRRPHRYEPEVTATYEELAAHYGCAILPARAYKPRDKAKVEAGVLVAERWILASLRHHTFFSVAEANAAIAVRLHALNQRAFKKLAGSRASWFAAVDRPAMRPLPAQAYELATWKPVTVNLDYHVEVDRHYYSVPYLLARQRCEVRVTTTTVEVFHQGRRVASHERRAEPGRHTTCPAHMPESHRRHREWTPSRLIRWAEQTGPQTAALVQGVLESRPHPEQGFRACLGVMRLGRRYGGERLEGACARAVAVGAFRYRSVESILRTGLDRQPLPAPAAADPAPRLHANVRGPAAYQ